MASAANLENNSEISDFSIDTLHGCAILDTSEATSLMETQNGND